MCANSKRFGCVEECRLFGDGGLCGIEWAISNIVGYMEESELCGIEWAMWKSVGYIM